MKKTYPNYKVIGKAELKPINKKILKDYLNFVKITAGEKKLQQYKIYMLQFIDIIEKPINKISKQEVEEFWGLINHSDKAIPTKNFIRLVVKRFLKWYYKDLDMIENLHMQKHLVDRNKRKKSNLLTPLEIESMLRNAGSFRNKLIVCLLYETAGRPEEIRLLKWNDISLENKLVTLYSNKTKQSREIPINKSITWLEAWRKDYQFSNVNDNDYLFPCVDRTKPISPSFFTKLIKRIGVKSQIKRVIIPYIFRHTKLQEIHDRGASDLIHRKFAGHTTDSKMTSVYVEIDDKDMQEAVKKLYDVELSPEEENDLREEVKSLKQTLILILKQLKKDLPKDYKIPFPIKKV